MSLTRPQALLPHESDRGTSASAGGRVRAMGCLQRSIADNPPVVAEPATGPNPTSTLTRTLTLTLTLTRAPLRPQWCALASPRCGTFAAYTRLALLPSLTAAVKAYNRGDSELEVGGWGPGLGWGW